jgi:hypothetical protein
VDELEAAFGEFFPGSRHRRPESDITIEEEVENPWDTNPKVLILHGQEVEFFTIGALAQALDREVVTIRKWERLGYIPKATYRAGGKRQDRLYTRAQIEGLVAIARDEGLFPRAKRLVIGDTRFTDRAIHLFHSLENTGA